MFSNLTNDLLGFEKNGLEELNQEIERLEYENREPIRQPDIPSNGLNDTD